MSERSNIPVAAEDQDSVVRFFVPHYPDEVGYAPKKLLNLVEELGEVAAFMDADIEDLVTQFRLSAARTTAKDRQDPSALAGEIADTQIGLYELADSLGLRVTQCLDNKMATLRSRTPEESAARLKRKQAMGIGLDPSSSSFPG
jgi:hypothetical protein